MEPINVVGLMSGTSGDGVDAVLLRFAGAQTPHLPELLGEAHQAFPAELSAALQRPSELSLEQLAILHQVALPAAYAAAVQAIPGWERASLCGMHGQTVWHRPPPQDQPCTLQIGNAGVLAQRLQRPVVADMRTADMLQGGQGAPIAPVAHWFFGRGLAPEARDGLLVVNLGGICNLSWVTPALEDVCGYDVGPGMVYSDAFARASTDGRLSCDLDGQLSQGGQLLPALQAKLLAHPFVAGRRPSPPARRTSAWPSTASSWPQSPPAAPTPTWPTPCWRPRWPPWPRTCAGTPTSAAGCSTCCSPAAAP